MKCPRCNGTGEIAIEGLTTGDLIMKHRASMNWTQDQLSAECGLSRAQIANVEVGRSDIPLRTLRRIAEALKISAKDLIP